MRKSILASVCLTLGVSSVALAGDATAVVKAVEAKYTDVSVIQAQFVQTTRSEIFGAEQQSGAVTLKRPSMMRWSFEGEQGKEFVTNGSTMWVYNQADKQVIRYDNVGDAASTADSLLQSLDKLDDMFAVDLLDTSTEDSFHLSLAPKGEDQQFKKLLLNLDSGYVVQRVEIVDAFDQVTELDFSAVKFNVDAPDTLFTFEVPEGIELVTVGS